MSAKGKERRRRFVYVTRNTEYHTLDGVCVGVRDRRSGKWIDRHAAVRRRVEGGIRVFSNGCVLPTLEGPVIGAPMYFELAAHEEKDAQLVTSRIESIDRPAPDDLDRYPRKVG